MSASIQRLPVTIPPGVWTEVLSGFLSITVQVGSPGQVWPLHDREIDFIFSLTPPTGTETDRFQVLLDDKHLNRWTDPVTLGTNTAGAKLYAKPVKAGFYGLLRVVSWDTPAAAFVGMAGAVVQADRSVWVDGRIFLNPTSGPLTVPTPATRLTMITAGFRDVTETSRRYDLTTSISVTATEVEHGIFARSTAGDIVVEFPVDLPVLSQRVAARDGLGQVLVRFGDGTVETIDGQASFALDQDAFVYLIKETATTWRTAEQNVSSGFASETLAGLVEIATVAEAVAGTDNTRVVTPEGVAAAIAAIQAATDTVAGIVELATVAEAVAGTDTERAVTAEGVAAAINGRLIYNQIPATGIVAANSFYFVSASDNIVMPTAPAGSFVRLLPEMGLLWSAWSGTFTTPTGVTINNGVLSSVDLREIVLVLNSAGTSWLVRG